MFSKFELTNKGVELLNRVIAEQKTLKFTKFQIGKGDFSGDKKTLTQLVSKIDEFNVSQTNVLADGITNIKGFYDNRNLSVASKLTEIGIMAQLGNDSLTEVLFSYSNQPNTEAETIPSKESYFSRTFSVMNRTDNVTSVTFDLTIRQDKYNFGTLAEMKAADYLDVGDKVTLWGNAALGDSSFKMYIITDQTQPIQLNNKLYAKEYFKIVNDLTTGGADKAGSAEMVKKLGENKQNKTDDGLKTDSKEIVGAINESLWKIRAKDIGNRYSVTDLIDFIINSPCGQYVSNDAGNKFTGLPNGRESWAFALTLLSPNMFSISKYKFAIYYEYSNGNIFYGEVVNGRFNGWQEILSSNSKLFLGNSGISKVIYIQDAGQKTAGNGYVDKSTGQLYLCKTTNSDTSVTSNFVLATNIEIAKRQHFTKTILFDKPTGHVRGTITLSDNWENYDEFIVYGSGDNVDYVGSHRFKKEDIEYSISKGQRFMIYVGANDYWLSRITTGSKTWGSDQNWENCAIFRIIGIKYGG